MRKLLASSAVLRLTGRNFPVLAVTVLALLGAGCADEPQQAGQTATVQSTPASIIVPAPPTVVSGDGQLECEYLVPAGTATHKWFCFMADEDVTLPVAANDDDPLLCQYVVTTGTMFRKWNCISLSELTILQQQRRRRTEGVKIIE
jgi:hypothetical protein